MKKLLGIVVLGLILLAGCSGGYDKEDETVLETAEAEEEKEDFSPF